MSLAAIRQRRRELARQLYNRPGEPITVAGRSWLVWREGNAVDAWSIDDASGIPCVHNVLYGWMGTPRDGESVDQAILRQCERYGGLGPETAETE